MIIPRMYVEYYWSPHLVMHMNVFVKVQLHITNMIPESYHVSYR